MSELWQMATDVMICADMWRPSVMGVREVRQDKRVEVNPLCGRCISRNFNNVHILKNTSLALNCMVTFLTMFKENKINDFFYKILVSL